VTYFYKLPGTHAGLQRCAAIAPGDAASEAAHGYSASGSTVLTNSWRYPGRQPFIAITNAGRHTQGAVQFTVPLTPSNAGVRLRRQMDAGIGGQRAAVLVDGAIVGDWDSPDTSFADSQHRWNDAEFTVPRGFTAGKTGMVVRIERDPGGAAVWTDYGWEIFAIAPLDSPADTDRDGLPDTWEVAHFGRTGLQDGEADADSDGARNIDEWTAETDPTDHLSRLAFTPSPPATLRFMGITNRVYVLQRTADIVIPEWTDTAIAVTGSARSVSIDLPSGADHAFFRLRLAP
jgi:hypothetical protein